MARYLAGRLLQGLFVLWGVTIVVFVLIHLVPGDPGRLILGSRVSPQAVAHLDHKLGVDRSMPEQYVRYLGDLVRGNLGASITQHTAVSNLISPRMAPSLLLIGYSIVIALLVAVPLALLSAIRANLFADHVVRLTSVMLLSIPSFWLGLMLAVVLGLELGWFPTSGYNGGSPVELFKTLTLPALAIGLSVVPGIMRLLRSSIVESLQAEFVEAARARGLGGTRVLVRHVLRTSLTSTVTLIAASIGGLLSGTLVVEQVFAIPGLGSLLVDSVSGRDYPTVQALTFIFTVFVVIGNLVADLTYFVLDPRVRR